MIQKLSRITATARSGALVLSTALALLAAPGAQAADERRPAVLLISVDGLSPDYVLDADRLGLQIPVLRGFVQNGAYASRVVNVTPTVTYPNHTALVTGVGPREHGIHTNTLFDPEGVEKGAWNWYGEQIKAHTLWAAAKDQGLTTAAVLWPVSVAHPAIDYNVPEYWRVKRPSDDFLLQAVSTPRGFLQSVRAVDSLFVNGGKEDNEWAFDAKLTEIALAMIEQARPHLLTVHLVGLDGAQHGDGPLPSSRLARETLEHLDTLIGRLIAAERKAHPDAVIAIASDHGFLPVDATVNLNAAFARAGLITLNGDGTLASWKAYAWNSGGSASVVLKDPADSGVAAAVERILTDLAATPANGIAAVLRGAEALAEGALPQASFMVDCRSGFAMGGALQGEVIQRQDKTTGTHGYRNTHPEMHSAFFVMGPGIEAGRNLGVIDIRSIAPTLAGELGAQLPEARQPALPLRR
ncbi:alkaline phosphatase family protein [Stenotrophomonas mori]|uniref:Ectonucleotide pyrophosphatase/phosphodiesterase n=1 Tax=Stenotrophomonas mori TaxID=2871096 RepID=A0ABT0SD46_9GAMM|nr:ectonucleotide pyrophosphatase/phosphodiesterase [Stenotrophomonas mori]MCL7713245.1 ectonucleotide pyrophosphatase/phosphodiesterase [Stenotrophomonas mori]